MPGNLGGSGADTGVVGIHYQTTADLQGVQALQAANALLEQRFQVLRQAAQETAGGSGAQALRDMIRQQVQYAQAVGASADIVQRFNALEQQVNAVLAQTTTATTTNTTATQQNTKAQQQQTQATNQATQAFQRKSIAMQRGTTATAAFSSRSIGLTRNIAQLAVVATSGSASIESVAGAARGTASQLAIMAKSARGGVVALLAIAGLTILLRFLSQTKERAEEVEKRMKGIGELRFSGTVREVRQLTQEVGKLEARLAEMSVLQRIIAEAGGLFGRGIVAELKQARQLLEGATDQQAEMIRERNRAAADFARQSKRESEDRIKQLQDEKELLNIENITWDMRLRRSAEMEIRLRQIRREAERRNTLLDDEGNILSRNQKLIEAEVEAEKALLDAQNARLDLEEFRQNQIGRKKLEVEGGSSVAERFRASEELFNLEAEAARRSAEDQAQVYKRLELQKRELIRATFNQAIDDAGTFANALQNSNVRALKSIGNAMQTFRKLVIGAEAAFMGVRALREGAEAIASLASGDLKGAALHGASALQFAKAAAVAAQESLGGGRASVGGGVGAPGVRGEGPTFAPSGAGGGAGRTVINLYSVDPYSGRAIARVRHEIERGNVLKTPIPVEPTAGFSPFGNAA